MRFLMYLSVAVMLIAGFMLGYGYGGQSKYADCQAECIKYTEYECGGKWGLSASGLAANTTNSYLNLKD